MLVSMTTPTPTAATVDWKSINDRLITKSQGTPTQHQLDMHIAAMIEGISAHQSHVQQLADHGPRVSADGVITAPFVSTTLRGVAPNLKITADLLDRTGRGSAGVRDALRGQAEKIGAWVAWADAWERASSIDNEGQVPFPSAPVPTSNMYQGRLSEEIPDQHLLEESLHLLQQL